MNTLPLEGEVKAKSKKTVLLEKHGFRASVRSPMDTNQALKCVVVGDGAVGKTALLYSFSKNSFQIPEDYPIPECYSKSVILNDSRPVSLTLWDTAGQDEYDRSRPPCYDDADVFLLLFSVISPPSLRNLEMKWFPKIQHVSSHVPIVVVATKTDLRSNADTLEMLRDRGMNVVSTEDGLAMAKRLGAKGYIECSAKTGEGLESAFAKAAKAVLFPKEELESDLKAKKTRPRSKSNTSSNSKCIVV
eukprot:TRINITY_DN1155_c0_g1_i1.p1 TRINITY_DN1155_c0_g1~~TRINITY_DN1155_c0_g1_i1.p1  ORF type:complete len:246 (-),score=32.33 TRINITY_DN1155_c0_g1_i1:208-945(-)